eukprot:2702331-Lingulodinium_polyedra.AAC.1
MKIFITVPSKNVEHSSWRSSVALAQVGWFALAAQNSSIQIKAHELTAALSSTLEVSVELLEDATGLLFLQCSGGTDQSEEDSCHLSHC